MGGGLVSPGTHVSVISVKKIRFITPDVAIVDVGRNGPALIVI